MRASLLRAVAKTNSSRPQSINNKLCATSTNLIKAASTTQLQLQPTQQTLTRTFGSRSRGTRGHGWLTHYRSGNGGRHLQGRYHNRDEEELSSINNSIFELGTSDCFLEIEVEGKDESDVKRARIVIELASKALPKTCENFIKLCQDGYYNDTKVHKIEKNVGVCMGDILGMDGNGGKCHPDISPYGYFENEAHVLSHVEKGVLTMLAPRVDKNDSRFLITLGDTPQLDGKYVAFGRVKGDDTDETGMKGLENIVANMYTMKGKPQKKITIRSCGLL